MEELIYILLGIAWVAYSFYKKSLKNKAANTPQPVKSDNSYQNEDFKIEDSDDENIVDDFFSNFFGEERLKSKTDFSTESTISRDEAYYNEDFSEQSEIKDEIEDFDPSKEGQSAIEDSSEDEIDYYSLETEEDIYEEFDLRKAVIYSEYMNRKYF
jgi:hypothetical protein